MTNVIIVAITVTIIADATTVAEKNVVGGNSGKTKIVATNATNALIAAINQPF